MTEIPAAVRRCIECGSLKFYARERCQTCYGRYRRRLKRSGEFTLPGMVKLSVRKSKARMGRNPATGEPIKIPAKTRVKATVVKAMKDAVMPRK